MNLSRETRLFCGVILLTVPSIMYGGVTLLGILTKGSAGLAPGGLILDDRQWALFRAGHAHAGVWVLLTLVLQVLLDDAALSRRSRLGARIAAPVGAILLPGGFFGTAFVSALRALIYLGAASMAVAVLLTGIGLIRKSPPRMLT
jgi:hypothetical protein